MLPGDVSKYGYVDKTLHQSLQSFVTQQINSAQVSAKKSHVTFTVFVTSCLRASPSAGGGGGGGDVHSHFKLGLTKATKHS